MRFYNCHYCNKTATLKYLIDLLNLQELKLNRATLNIEQFENICELTNLQILELQVVYLFLKYQHLLVNQCHKF